MKSTESIDQPLPPSVEGAPTTTDSSLSRDARTVILLKRAKKLRTESARECRRVAISLNMPMARGLARRYRNQGLALDDLYQVAYLDSTKPR